MKFIPTYKKINILNEALQLLPHDINISSKLAGYARSVPCNIPETNRSVISGIIESIPYINEKFLPDFAPLVKVYKCNLGDRAKELFQSIGYTYYETSNGAELRNGDIRIKIIPPMKMVWENRMKKPFVNELIRLSDHQIKNKLPTMQRSIISEWLFQDEKKKNVVWTSKLPSGDEGELITKNISNSKINAFLTLIKKNQRDYPIQIFFEDIIQKTPWTKKELKAGRQDYTRGPLRYYQVEFFNYLKFKFKIYENKLIIYFPPKMEDDN